MAYIIDVHRRDSTDSISINVISYYTIFL